MTTDPSDIVEQLRLNERMRRELASETADERRDYLLEEARLNAEAAAEITRLRAALAAAKTKLKLYRAQHSGEYIGGMEYGMLLDMINEVLGESKYDR